MITVKITKDLKIQKYLFNGIKILVNDKNKNEIYIIRLNEYQTKLLRFIISVLFDKNDGSNKKCIKS